MLDQISSNSERKRVYCLYRVSTIGQVEKDDIPMQKQFCREYCQRQPGWEIVKEFSEKGVSGFKKSAKDRDAIQEIQRDAAEGKFDILLVYMFDRLGRRDDETPFVVEWFVRNGVRVWSTVEGEQRFDSHVDKLMNYIRYWQASGESIKTSMRVKTRMEQLTQEGHYTGGIVPYGYRLEKKGRLNKKNQAVGDLAVEPDEAEVVRLIFEKYVTEGYGAQRLNRWLYAQGIRNRKGRNFTNSTIINMLKNIIYVGILKSGETRSEVFPELQIIPVELWDRAQEIMEGRTKPHNSEVPFNSKSRAMLSGLVYCGHCGSKLVLTTSGGSRYKPIKETRLRYTCHNKIRHPQDCDGQTGYSQEKLDGIVETLLRALFSNIKSVSEKELVSTQLEQKTAEQRGTLSLLKTQKVQKEKELDSYKSEVYKAIRGESTWDSRLLNELIGDTRTKLAELEAEITSAEQALADTDRAAAELREQYDRVLTWAELFDNSTTEGKKMIAYQLIRQVRVYRNFRIEIDLKMDFEQFKELWHRDDKKILVNVSK